MKYQDYYAVLGVPRTASQDEIRSAYRKLARTQHPDVDKSAGATQRFQQLAEAYEVLKDPGTRSRYDALGAAWKEGQDFTPPAGWQSTTWGGGREAQGGFGGFSDFFESLFGGRGGFSGAGIDLDGAYAERARRARRPREVEAELGVPLDTALAGGTHSFQIDTGEGARTIDVRIPEGSADGSVLRLRGQGGGGADLLLRLRVAAPPGFEADGDDLHTTLRVAPWEAALGGRIPLSGPQGREVVVNLPAGSSSGRTLRLRGLGLPRRGGGRGDLLAEVAVAVPERLSDAERELYEALARGSSFDPRRG